MTDPELAAMMDRQNRLLEQIADALEDRVIQEALKHDLELGTDSATGRRRQL